MVYYRESIEILKNWLRDFVQDIRKPKRRVKGCKVIPGQMPHLRKGSYKINCIITMTTKTCGKYIIVIVY